jgi:uncharacterized protein
MSWRTSKSSGIRWAKGFFQPARFKKAIGCWGWSGRWSNEISRDLHIVPRSPAKYLNHSCDPNLGVKMNENGLPDFYALRDIQAGEHLTFDYAMTEFMLEEMELGRDRTQCRCGAANCRGTIGSFSELPTDIKKRYSGFIADYLRED